MTSIWLGPFAGCIVIAIDRGYLSLSWQALYWLGSFPPNKATPEFGMNLNQMASINQANQMAFKFGDLILQNSAHAWELHMRRMLRNNNSLTWREVFVINKIVLTLWFQLIARDDRQATAGAGDIEKPGAEVIWKNIISYFLPVIFSCWNHNSQSYNQTKGGYRTHMGFVFVWISH